MDKPDFSYLPVIINRGKLFKRQTIEISRELVRVTGKGSFAAQWDEPVSAFKGILRRTDEDTSIGMPEYGGGMKVTIFLVELVHPDRRKTILLYKSDTEEVIRKLWKDAARTLHLPALDETSGGIVICAPEDLDKSIRDLAAEGKISTIFDADTPPPEGIVWKLTEDGLKVTLSRVSALFLDWIAKRRIVITPLKLSYFLESPFGIFSQKTILLNNIKNIRRISRVSSSLCFVIPMGDIVNSCV